MVSMPNCSSKCSPMCGAYTERIINKSIKASCCTCKSCSPFALKLASSLASSIKLETGVLSAKRLPKSLSILPMVSWVLRRRALASLLKLSVLSAALLSCSRVKLASESACMCSVAMRQTFLTKL